MAQNAPLSSLRGKDTPAINGWKTWDLHDASVEARKDLAAKEGLEPSTVPLTAEGSTSELLGKSLVAGVQDYRSPRYARRIAAKRHLPENFLPRPFAFAEMVPAALTSLTLHKPSGRCSQ